MPPIAIGDCVSNDALVASLVTPAFASRNDSIFITAGCKDEARQKRAVLILVRQETRTLWRGNPVHPVSEGDLVENFFQKCSKIFCAYVPLYGLMTRY